MPYFIHRQHKQIKELLERSDLHLYEEVPPDILYSIVKHMVSSLFVGITDTGVMAHIYDQIVLSSAESMEDPTLPTVDLLISWISTCLIMASQTELTLAIEKVGGTVLNGRTPILRNISNFF